VVVTWVHLGTCGGRGGGGVMGTPDLRRLYLDQGFVVECFTKKPLKCSILHKRASFSNLNFRNTWTFTISWIPATASGEAESWKKWRLHSSSPDLTSKYYLIQL
jgi:hypothetical protein